VKTPLDYYGKRCYNTIMNKETVIKDILLFHKEGLVFRSEDNKDYVLVLVSENEGSTNPSYTLKLRPIK